MTLEFGHYAADIVEFYAMKIIDYKCIKHMKYNFASFETTDISSSLLGCNTLVYVIHLHYVK
jgi:hypothetical protein